MGKLRERIDDVWERKRQLLFKYVFPLMNKLMD